MNTLVLLCHPAKDSLNHAFAARITDTLESAGHAVRFHDLYREGFDPVLSQEELQRRFSFDEEIQAHTSDLRWAQLLVFVHPDWWGGAPAILKGWLDRVFRPGVAYDYVGEDGGAKEHIGLLTEKAALVVCTTNGRSDSRGWSTAESSAARVWEESVFPFCGIHRHRICEFVDVRGARLRERRRWLDAVGREALAMADSDGGEPESSPKVLD